jgi:tetratricopeptide (TPR) repeat protein
MQEQSIRIFIVLALLSIPITSWATNPAVDDAVNHAANLITNHKENDAMPYLNRAINLDPERVDARILRAHIFIELDEPAKALQDLEVAFKHGKNAMAYQYRSQVMVMEGKPEKAIDDISNALALATSDSERAFRLCRRAEIYRSLKKPEKALVDITAAMALRTPDKPFSDQVLFRKRGSIYLELGENQKAAADFTAMLAQMKPNDVGRGRIFALRSMAYEKMGRHDLAELDQKKSKGYAEKDFGDLLK